MPHSHQFVEYFDNCTKFNRKPSTVEKQKKACEMFCVRGGGNKCKRQKQKLE